LNAHIIKEILVLSEILTVDIEEVIEAEEDTRQSLVALSLDVLIQVSHLFEGCFELSTLNDQLRLDILKVLNHPLVRHTYILPHLLE
jgi:hypothetical protein